MGKLGELLKKNGGKMSMKEVEKEVPNLRDRISVKMDAFDAKKKALDKFVEVKRNE